MSSKTWKLRKTKQCAKCPWKKSTNPYDIPSYDPGRHVSLDSTIATPGEFNTTGSMMACHESEPGDEFMCIGWLMNQAGRGNNIALRIRLMSCENTKDIQLDGEQHERFEDTLPRCLQ